MNIDSSYLSNFPLWFSGLFFLIWSRAHFQLFTFFASGYLGVLHLEHILMQPHYCLLFQPNPTHLLFAVPVWISISLVVPALGSRGEEKETENSILAFTTRQIGKSSRWNLGETSFQSNFTKPYEIPSFLYLYWLVCEIRSKE